MTPSRNTRSATDKASEAPPSSLVAHSPAVDFDRYHDLEEQMFEAMMGGRKAPLFLSAEKALEHFRETQKSKR